MQFKKGDRVKHVNNGKEGDVIFVHHNGDCSVDFDNGTLTLCLIHSLIKIGNFNVDVKELLESQGWTFDDQEDFVSYLKEAEQDMRLLFASFNYNDEENTWLKLLDSTRMYTSLSIMLDVAIGLYGVYKYTVKEDE